MGNPGFTSSEYDGRQSWRTAVCRMELIAVTGIAKTDENTAMADYTWKCHLSPVGPTVWKSVPELAGQDQNASFAAQATFQRFDDGWRVAN